MIKVKDLLIFKNTKRKKNTILSNYKSNKPIFQDYLLDDNNDNKAFIIDKNNYIALTSKILKNKNKNRLLKNTAKTKKLKQNSKLNNINIIKPKKANTVKLKIIGIAKKKSNNSRHVTRIDMIRSGH